MVESKEISLGQLESKLAKSRKTGRGKKGCKRLIFGTLFAIVAIVVIMVLLATFFPQIFLVVINIFWLILVGMGLIFLLLGVLVMFGLRKEAERLINIMLEGSLSLIDVADFFKDVLRTFKRLAKEFVLFVTPIFSLLTGFLIYLLLLYLYKWYGREHDLTIFTVILTAILIFISAIMNKPVKEIKKFKSWGELVRHRFSKSFKDSLEVVIFVFFITLDSTNLFFLPPELNIELHAAWGDYNLMTRSFTFDNHLRTTITLVTAAILIEVLRNAFKLGFVAYKNFRLASDYLENKGREFRTVEVIKISMRESVRKSMDELVKFIVFTTVLISVFLIFPRLKLLSMVVASFTALIMDFIIIDRLKISKGEDLISRLLAKIFRL